VLLEWVSDCQGQLIQELGALVSLTNILPTS